MDFDDNEIMISVIKQLKKEDVISFYKEVF